MPSRSAAASIPAFSDSGRRSVIRPDDSSPNPTGSVLAASSATTTSPGARRARRAPPRPLSTKPEVLGPRSLARDDAELRVAAGEPDLHPCGLDLTRDLEG